MKRSERQLLWQFPIQAFHTSVESSVAAWCAKQNVPVQSMYQWLRKSRTQIKIQPAEWLPVVMQEAVTPETILITIKLNGISIECPANFEEVTLSKNGFVLTFQLGLSSFRGIRMKFYTQLSDIENRNEPLI